MNTNEKLSLSAELGALSANLMTTEAVNQLKAQPQAEYESLLSEIESGYTQAASEAAATRDSALAAANEAITAANSAYRARMEELDEKKASSLSQAEEYYRECVAQVNATIDEQNNLRTRYTQAQARLAEIEKQEEEERLAAEAAAKAAAEEAARKAREQEQARIAAARAAGATVPARKPHIRF